MKVVMDEHDNRLLVYPETEFESDWLSRLGRNEEKDLEAFHKTGLSAGDYIGIVIRVKK